MPKALRQALAERTRSERFTAIVVIDGSRLAAIARRLKLLWAERAVVLPGCLLGLYHQGRGLCRAVRHARYFILQLAERHLTPTLFRQILRHIERLASDVIERTAPAENRGDAPTGVSPRRAASSRQMRDQRC